MIIYPFLPDRAAADDAIALLATHGDFAGAAAAQRADAARDLGNHVHFCRWRQIERLIVMLSVTHIQGSVH
jgi:sugar phosphate isomerase/epimerase